MSEASQAVQAAVHTINTTHDDAYIKFGKFLGVRRYGNTAHVQITSWGPPTAGSEHIVVHGDDIPYLGLALLKLAGVEVGIKGENEPKESTSRSQSVRTKTK